MENTGRKTAVYYGGAILFSWSLWIGTIFISFAHNIEILYNEGFYGVLTGGVEGAPQLLSFLFFTAAAYGPLFGVIVVHLVWKGDQTKRIAKFVERGKETGSVRWLLFIFLYPIILFSAALLVTWIVIGFSREFNWLVLPLWFIPVLFVFQCFTSGVEKFGWRGFLQPLLQTRYSVEKVCFRVGILWSVWHYPIIVFMNYPNGVVVVLLTLAGFTMLTIPQAYVIGWLFNSTKSVWLCVFLHAWANTVSAYLLAASPVPQLTPIVVAIGAWLVANYLLKKYGKEKLSTQTG